ncbi:MAG: flagellar motor stator protein MotA [Rickettsiales bacterium]|nr:flagellar motor stator protein MotA [Rickettsiales bacterium]
MAVIVGILLVLVMSFGGFILAGGKFGIILHALPFEMMIIGGSAVGAFVSGNTGVVLKKTLKDFSKIFKGAKWKRNDYQDVLALWFEIAKFIRTKGLLGLESHLENPKESEIFKKYPKILGDHFAVDFICDTLRLMTMNRDDPNQVEDSMEKLLEKHHHEATTPADSMQSMADALPALGIVAAVLGVIKTMASITEPPEILGAMIGGALVGTFLGVFLAYGIVGPMASRLKQTYEEEAQFYYIIRDAIVAHLHGHAPQVSVEIGRGNVPSHLQPSFQDLEAALSTI